MDRPLKDYGLKPFVYLSHDLPRSAPEPWTLICQLPYNAQFTLFIRLHAEAGGRTVRFDSTNPLVYCQQEEQDYTTVAGEQRYEAPGWVSGEGARYTIPAGVTVLDVQYRETGYDTEFTGSFSCNDADYNRLWEKATRTCYLCMREHFMDCPDRERAEWLGDAVLQMEECFYAFDLKSHDIVRTFIRSQQVNALPGQNLIAHGEYGDWAYYLYTGDLDTLAFVYANTKAYLDRYLIGENGVPEKRGDGWDWYDWGTGEQDRVVIQAAQVFGALAALAKMAEATGHTEDLPEIEGKLESIRANFDRVFWQDDGYRSGDFVDERAGAMAVCAGLAGPDKWETIAELIGTDGPCGPYFERWVLEALCIMGKAEQALLRMYTRYRAQIDARVTTLYEYMVRAHEDKEGTDSVNYTTLNHGWNVPNTILSRFIAGLEPLTPAWETYQVMPQEAFLHSLSVSVTTVKGQVDLEIRKSIFDYRITLRSPAGTTAIVGVPKASFTSLDSISVGAACVWGGSDIAVVSGVTSEGEDERYVRFALGPGLWEIVARGTLDLSTPKAPATEAADRVGLDKKDWRVSASIDDQEFLAGPWKKVHKTVSAASHNAIDGDAWTGWRTMQDQVPGQWFAIDMQEPQTFDRIVLDNVWAIHDSPAGYAVYVSDDAGDWGAPVAEGEGDPTGITTITFPEQHARHIKIEQTGTKDQCWSIFEVDVLLVGYARRYAS